MSRQWEAVEGWRCSECGHVIIGPIDVNLDAWHEPGCVPDGSLLARMRDHEPAELNELAKIITGSAGPRHPLFSVRYGIAVGILESEWLAARLAERGK